jgi:broad specificity phosphatase PhoE
LPLEMRLIFVRHGESVSNADAERLALPEHEGDRLTENGRAQARTVARTLAGSDATALLSSPMSRAAETAAEISAVVGLAVETNPLIHELREADGYGELELDGQRAERWSTRMAARADDPGFASDGAESFADVVGRVHGFKRELAEREGEGPVIAVSHGIFQRFFLVDSLLAESFTPAAVERLWQLRTINCGISVFTLGEKSRAIDPDVSDWACLSWMAPPTAPVPRPA